MSVAKAKKEKPLPGPDDLVRESAGAYRSGDGRFEVQKSDLGWYLVDTQESNEFGQQLIHGPLATLDAIRDAIPRAREIKPLLRVRPKKALAPRSAAGSPPKPEPPPPPPTWIDRLPDKEAAEVRRLIRALEKEGFDDPEELVRRHRDDTTPTITTRVLEHRLREIADDSDPDNRAAARKLIARVVDELALNGNSVRRPLLGWALVEIASHDDAAPRRRLRPRTDAD